MSEQEHGHVVVVGVDGSPSSFGALDWAATQCARSGARLLVVVAWEWPTSYGWAMPLPQGYEPEDDAKRLVEEGEARARALHPSIEVGGITMEGGAAASLIEASRDATMLVVGSRGHGQLAGMLLGSVSKHCVVHARCPVVVYRELRGDRGRSDDLARTDALGRTG